jgi:glycosyltransferase involved in cell wall biosynthesis
MVSILCLAYNHEKYIAQALDSFINQKTNFKYEVIINEDCSSDNTKKIIQQYEKRYPTIIKPIYQKENQYSKKVNIEVDYLIPNAKGKYFCFCEGDDYFIDNNKLQKQYDFLENNMDYNFCVHNAIKVNSQGEKIGEVRTVNCSSDLKCEDFISGGGSFVVTNSIFARKILLNDIPVFLKNFPLDYFWQIYLSSKGKTFCFSNEMSAYRFNTEGSWTNKMKKDLDKKIIHNKRVIKGLMEFDDYSNKEYHSLIIKHIFKLKQSIFFIRVKKMLKNKF